MRFRIPAAALSICALVISLLAFWQHLPGQRASIEARETVYQRVLRTNEIRVGYFVEPPYLDKETSSGRLSGVFYDFMELLGRNLGFKVSWVEEVNLANLASGLDTGRYDMIAFTLWRSAARARTVAFSVPLFYTPVGIYVRADDHRFDGDVAKLNAPDVRVAAIDGELAATIAKESFPKALIASQAQLVDYSQLLLDVASKKADVTFFSRVYADRFIARNPNSVRDISAQNPARVFAECFVLPIGDSAFASMMNAAIQELLDNGGFQAVLRANHEDPRQYLLPLKPYASDR